MYLWYNFVSMTVRRVLIFLSTIIVVSFLGIILGYYAKGYRFDNEKLWFVANGILVIKSDPDGAQVYINGELKTATNATILLLPKVYDITIKKEGYRSWNKRLTIQKEVVTEASAYLFKTAPSLSPLTFNGSINPTPSDDGSKIAYTEKKDPTKPTTALWVIETLNLPIGFSKDPKLITEGDLTGASWIWSPDGREILFSAKTGKFLLDAGSQTPQSKWVNIDSKADKLLKNWADKRKASLVVLAKNLPDGLNDILTRKVSNIVFSPDETKILYTASSSADIAENLIPSLPGSSTQKQERNIKESRTYIYDIKEDRNFLITDQEVQVNSSQSTALRWLPTSRHLVLSEPDKITIMDYDGTNRQVVYSGSYVAPYAFPFVNSSKLIILTNLGADSAPPNLYSLTLK